MAVLTRNQKLTTLSCNKTAIPTPERTKKTTPLIKTGDNGYGIVALIAHRDNKIYAQSKVTRKPPAEKKIILA